MPKEDLRTYQHNLQLKQEFEQLELDLQEVFEFTPLDLDLENNRLESLLDFTKKYQQYGSREVMELLESDFCFPPIYPMIEPESDWYRFERWMNGESVREKIADQLPEEFIIRPLSSLTDNEVETELEKLIDAIEHSNFSIDLSDNIPAELVYANLLEWLEETTVLYPKGNGGFFVYNGCNGYCPGCFQRPWCETGNSSCWSEDEQAEKMHFPEELGKYVSASPQSLDIIRELQAKKDAAFEKFKEENKEEIDDDWKAELN